MLTAKEAADAVGMSKQGLLKAIRLGKLSAQKDENNEWQIDPVELFRVYSPKKTQVIEVADESHNQIAITKVEALERELAIMRERINDKDETIRNLWNRLEAESSERQKLTFILTDQSHQQKPVEKSFWDRLFGAK